MTTNQPRPPKFFEKWFLVFVALWGLCLWIFPLGAQTFGGILMIGLVSFVGTWIIFRFWK